MIQPENFYNCLQKNGTNFFAGVPDSLLKNFCAYVTDNTDSKNHIISANEGSATALAAGYYFATGGIPLIYMQNSGEGNMINPLLSLADSDVYSVPMLILIGWRGEPGVHDEPQHVKQGKVTCDLLDAMKVKYEILTDDESKLEEQILHAYEYIKKNNTQFAFVIKKDTFAEYKLIKNKIVDGKMTREEAIDTIISNSSDSTAFVSTTGMTSRELYELRDKYEQGHMKDFLTVGSMGHASQIALSIAIQKSNKLICCLDGDGAAIMQMGGMATIGSIAPSNFIHVVLNNGAHDSVGGQPTIGRQINLCGIAISCGYKKAFKIESKDELKSIISKLNEDFKNGSSDLAFIEVKVLKGARKDLGRPKTTPIENKNAFMEFLK